MLRPLEGGVIYLNYFKALSVVVFFKQEVERVS